ncbi:MAG: porin family protein [Acidobacteria bacterium]|nr:porin family protein [Acidobacteriota bacterium]
MSLRKLIITAALVIMSSVAAPATASADWLFTPFLGATFGGSANIGVDGEDFDDEFERKLNYGASLAWTGGGAVGFEIDFGYSPNFFQVSTDDDDFDFAGDSNVTTLMANLTVGSPVGTVRPYAVGGLGLIKSRIDDAPQFFDDLDTTDFGFNLGGGVMGFFSENIGIRGDIRYFRSFQDDEEDDDDLDLGLSSFKFWRGTVGITFKF